MIGLGFIIGVGRLVGTRSSGDFGELDGEGLGVSLGNRFEVRCRCDIFFGAGCLGSGWIVTVQLTTLHHIDRIMNIVRGHVIWCSLLAREP